MSAQSTPALDDLRAEALAAGRGPRRRGSWYVAEHMLRTMRAYGWTIVVGAVGQPVMYLFGLGFGLAALLGQQGIQAHGQSVPYIAFVAPALLVSASVAVATEELSYPVLGGFKWRRYFYGFNASALSSSQIANGVIIGAAARMAFAVVAFYVLIWLLPFGGVPTPGTGWLSVPAGIGAGLSFGIALMAYAGTIEEDKGQFALVQRFVFMPLFLFSGTFYPLESLGALQWIGWISPLWHGAELSRAATYGADIAPAMIGVHIAFLVVSAALGYLWARRVFIRRLAR